MRRKFCSSEAARIPFLSHVFATVTVVDAKALWVRKSKTPHENQVAAMIAFLINSGKNGGALTFDLEQGRRTAICFSFSF